MIYSVQCEKICKQNHYTDNFSKGLYHSERSQLQAEILYIEFYSPINQVLVGIKYYNIFYIHRISVPRLQQSISQCRWYFSPDFFNAHDF